MSGDPRPSAATAEEIPRCERHGERTRLTCVDCGAPICPQCMTRTEVGLKCERDAAPSAVVQVTGWPRRRVLMAAGAAVAGVVALVVAAWMLGGLGGGPASAPAEPGPVVGEWEAVDALQTIRGSTSAVTLADGRVAVIGGGVGSVPIGATEIRDEGGWVAGGELGEPRRGHRAVVLDDGRVLVAGGIAGGVLLSSAEIADAELGSWAATGELSAPRLGHTMTLLRDGTVLVTGGTGGAETDGDSRQSVAPTATAEVYDPETGEWTPVGDMIAARFEHTATALPDGRVLIVGGLGVEDGDVAPLASAELYDPATGTFTRTGEPSERRTNHAAVALDDGRVLVVGGDGGSAAVGTAELYDATRGTFAEAPSLAEAREGHTAVVLDDGSVLVAGGEFFTRGTRRSLVSAERWEPGADAWANAGEMSCPRSEHAAALLPDGTALELAGDAAFPGEPPKAQSCVDAYTP